MIEHGHYRRRRVPYGLPFLDTKDTALLQEKSRAAQSLLDEKGYARIMPPSLDYPDAFELYERYDSFHTRDHLGVDLSLRNDVTVQVIKGFANILEEETGERRLYYTVPVFRDISKSYPALREVYQIGAEAIGLESRLALRELMGLSITIMNQVFKSSFQLLLGDVRAYYLLEKFAGEDLHDIVRYKNAPMFARVLEKNNIEYARAEKIARLLFFRPADEKLFWENWEKEKSVFPSDLVEELENIWRETEKFAGECSDKMQVNVRWEPLLIRKAAYYTGFIFEGYVQGLINPPLRGGSYDKLVAEYSARDVPASGFALDLSAMVSL